MMTVRLLGTKIKAFGFQYVSDGGVAWKTIIEEKGLQFVDGCGTCNYNIRWGPAC
ncbi:MAG: hypothetical protein Nk1A_5780 [Endomicrobiia bacterium]|nr:MAG: hypothetical protein Nk1A_5780 [Endomicrobiia bacterium]